MTEKDIRNCRIYHQGELMFQGPHDLNHPEFDSYFPSGDTYVLIDGEESTQDLAHYRIS
jgi:hypothetical protein